MKTTACILAASLLIAGALLAPGQSPVPYQPYPRIRGNVVTNQPLVFLDASGRWIGIPADTWEWLQRNDLVSTGELWRAEWEAGDAATLAEAKAHTDAATNAPGTVSAVEIEPGYYQFYVIGEAE